nr:DNA starvation/stationary phase protection protein [uncultured Celeribacter sp.]
MTQALKAVPNDKKLSTGPRETDRLAEALADVLADTYRLLIKTHIYHWNVEGPLFYSLHTLTEEQYNNLFEASDELAERIRALGHLTPMNIADVLGGDLSDKDGKAPSAEQMVADLAEAHERLAHRLHALIRIADTLEDPVTSDLATARSAFHEKAAWMLRATLGS